MKKLNRFSATAIAVLTVALRVAGAEHAWTIDDLKPPAPTSRSNQGRRRDSLFSRDYAALLWDDTRGLLTSPVRWKQNDWLLAGGLTAVTAGASIFDDNMLLG